MSDGLEDVVAADTVLSDVDGKAGRLIIRGRSLDELAGRTTYEEVTRLLWDGFFDDLPDDLQPALAAARVEVFAEVSALDTGLLDRTPDRGHAGADRQAGRRRRPERRASPGRRRRRCSPPPWCAPRRARRRCAPT